MSENSNYEMIFCVINAGFSDTVMDAAREAGARGGTVIRARGTAGKEAEELFSITVHPDKEVVMILVPKDIKDAVMTAIYRSAGMNAAGQGIAFSMAVSRTVGLQ